MRSRNIKPGFFINEQLSEVDFQTRLLFIGLWCYADREGRFQWIPKRIKVAIFPYDNLDTPAIETMLCNLMSLHLITCFDKVGYIENFKKHQSPHPHEAKSVLPEKPQQNQCHDMSLTLHGMSGECNSDIRILGCSDVRNPDVIIPDVIKPKKSKAQKSKPKPQPTFENLNPKPELTQDQLAELVGW